VQKFQDCSVIAVLTVAVQWMKPTQLHKLK